MIKNRTRQKLKTKKSLDKVFHLVIDSIRDYAIFLLDPTGHVITWNLGAERIKGYREREIVGKHFSVFYPPEALAARKPEHYLEIARREGSVEDEGWRIKKDGSRFWASVVITALRNGQGHLIGYAKVTRDMTEQRSIKEQLRRSKDDLEKKVQERTAALTESNRELEQFAYVASHDLQEPIRKIIIYGERLDDVISAPKQREWLNRINASGHHLRNIVQDLLQFSRISHVKPKFEWSDLREVVKEAMDDLEVKVGESKAQIDIGKLPELEINPNQFRHVFQNLISNSLKFARRDVPPHITISSESRGSSIVRLTVSDNGIGFDPQYAERIFQPFQRLHTKSEYEGTGIGLSIVNKIVAAHNGRISATSQPNQGATFSIEIPVKQPHPHN